MQELFYTLLIGWVIWKIFGAFNTSSSRSGGQRYQQTNHHHYYSQKEKDQVRVETKEKPSQRIPNDEGEYVDYEEIK